MAATRPPTTPPSHLSQVLSLPLINASGANELTEHPSPRRNPGESNFRPDDSRLR